MAHPKSVVTNDPVNAALSDQLPHYNFFFAHGAEDGWDLADKMRFEVFSVIRISDVVLWQKDVV